MEIEVVADTQLDLRNIFGNENDIHLEIGSGRGEFLEKVALQNRNINYLGIDVKEKRIRTIIRRLDDNLYQNVRLMRIFVDENIIKIIPKSSFKRIYIIHPDPWPKKKHHRRRLINENFIDTMNMLLRESGTVHISTDHSEYADWIVNKFSLREDFVSCFQDRKSMTIPEGHIATHFEEKKRMEGFPPIFMKYKKVKDL